MAAARLVRLLAALAGLTGLPATAGAAAPVPERLVLRVLDARGVPVAGAHVLTIEGNADYIRQGITRSDSTGTAVAEVGGNAYVGLRIVADGFEPWRLDLAPGAPDRRRRVIEIRLSPRREKGSAVPASY